MSARRHRGAALITALFLLVGIAAAVGLVANVTGTQQVSSGRAIDAARAHNAARTRLEREIATVANSTPPGVTCPTTGTVTIDGYTTELEDCQAVTVSEGGDDYDVFTLRVSAHRGNRTDGTLVRRELRALVTNG